LSRLSLSLLSSPPKRAITNEDRFHLTFLVKVIKTIRLRYYSYEADSIKNHVIAAIQQQTITELTLRLQLFLPSSCLLMDCIYTKSAAPTGTLETTTNRFFSSLC